MLLKCWCLIKLCHACQVLKSHTVKLHLLTLWCCTRIFTMLLKSRWFEKIIRPCLAMLAMPCHAANCRTILRHRVLLLFILVTATAFTTFPTLSDKTRNIQYMCVTSFYSISCAGDNYMGVYLIYGSPNFWKPHCVCIQFTLCSIDVIYSEVPANN